MGHSRHRRVDSSTTGGALGLLHEHRAAHFRLATGKYADSQEWANEDELSEAGGAGRRTSEESEAAASCWPLDTAFLGVSDCAGFRVQALGFRVWGLGFRVQGRKSTSGALG